MKETTIRVFDNGGKTFDRYTVVIDEKHVYCMSSNPSDPQGVNQHNHSLEPGEVLCLQPDDRELTKQECERLPLPLKVAIVDRI